MSSDRTPLALVVALSFVAGAGVGAAGVLLATRGGSETAPTIASDDTAAGAARASGELVASRETADRPDRTGVYINQRPVTQAQLDELKRAYGAAPPAARYWYDPRSGLYGIWQFEAAGYIRPGHDFGPLPPEASNGITGVFINGRQLNMNEALYIQKTFGAVYQGRWWLDGNGNFGQEGVDMPMGNLVAALQATQRSGGGGAGGYRWRDEINRSSGGAENGCVWVNTPGSSYMSNGC